MILPRVEIVARRGPGGSRRAKDGVWGRLSIGVKLAPEMPPCQVRIGIAGLRSTGPCTRCTLCPKRRSALSGGSMLKRLFVVACALVLAVPALAQDYPNRPIRIVVPFGPGGGGDIVGRIFGQVLQDRLGQPVVIENKPGAAGTLGNELVARAEKDGYTIGVMTAGQIIAAAMNKSLRYDQASAFEPISQVGTASLMLVARGGFPATN